VLEHGNWALVTTAGFALIAFVRLVLNLQHPPPPRWIRSALAAAAFVALATLFETGERGARLVFEYGVGVSAPGVVSPKHERQPAK
jgi:uncharacterized membrane protein